MKKFYLILVALFIFINNDCIAQTITFKACPNLFDNNTFTFNKTGTDATARNIYQTTPITGDQPCSGLGTCEFMIKWNTTNNRWEFLADTGNGDFSNPDLIYYNTSASTPNPPSLSLGTWAENTAITNNQCGGNLSSSNATMGGTGVQNSTYLGTVEQNRLEFRIYPNPTKDYVTITTKNPSGTSVQLYDAAGKLVGMQILKVSSDKVDLQKLPNGTYILKIQTGEETNTVKIIKQN